MSADARPRSPRRRRWPKWLAVVVFVAVAFAVGVALGESLSAGPTPAGTQSLVRTLRSLPLAPAARTTVTVTVTHP